MADHTHWTPVSPWTGLAEPRALAGAGVTVRPLPDLHLASVLARRGCHEALADRVMAIYQIDLPDRPRREARGAMAFVGAGPNAWLAVSEAGDSGWPAELVDVLSGLASVCDQSDGYAALRLQGPRVVDLLAKGLFLDLHLSAFPVGASAGASISHIGVTLWRREAAAFDLLVARSYAGSFWHWLEDSAGEYGMAVSV